MEKYCGKCRKVKDTSLFSKNASSKDGLQYFCKDCAKAYRESIREELRLYMVDYWQENSEELTAQKKQYYLDNPDKDLQRREKKRQHAAPYQKQRAKTDVQFRLTSILRSRLRNAIREGRKAGSAVADLGCSVEHLKEYLAGLFEPGMSWDNWGIREGQWSIDHIMPLSAFDLEDRQHFLLACHYLNLQPMWSHENFSKGDSIPLCENIYL